MTGLCQLLGDWNGRLPEGGALVSEKIDGWRCLHLTGIDAVPRLYSRNGIPIRGAGHIFARLQAMEREAGEPLFIEGELQVGGTLAATKAWCERGWKSGDAGHFHAFDMLSMAEWRAGGSDRPYYLRKQRLEQLVAATAPIPAGAYDGPTPDAWEWPAGSKGRIEPDPLSVVPDEWASDAGDVLAIARRIWAENGEGVVVKDAESPYLRCRSNAWQKVKQENRAKWMRATKGA